jgi:hypothetical protein
LLLFSYLITGILVIGAIIPARSDISGIAKITEKTLRGHRNRNKKSYIFYSGSRVCLSLCLSKPLKERGWGKPNPPQKKRKASQATRRNFPAKLQFRLRDTRVIGTAELIMLPIVKTIINNF